jgi:hypothetical protein
VRAGADWVVVGRPIRDARDRLAAARAIGAEVDAARLPGEARASPGEGRGTGGR